MVAMEEHHEHAFFYTDEYKGTKELLETAIKGLPASQKSVLLLRDYEGYSYKEIAEITELNESQVKVYIHRARMFMRAFITKMEGFYSGNESA
jgi:RNA polymerase sigma-70 factor (ECF subfamily)